MYDFFSLLVDCYYYCFNFGVYKFLWFYVCSYIVYISFVVVLVL